MSEIKKGGGDNNDGDGIDSATLTWDSLAEDINWLEEQAKSDDEAIRTKAVRLIKENYANMQKLLDEVSGSEKTYDDPKSIISNQRENEAVSSEKKARQMAAGEPISFKTDEEAREEMKRRYEEQD